MLKLTYSNLEFQNFPEDPGPPSSRGGREEREGEGKGRREGKDREGREGREGTGEGRREGGEGSHVTWATSAKSSLLRFLCSRLRPDVHDIHTSDVRRRQTRIVA